MSQNSQDKPISFLGIIFLIDACTFFFVFLRAFAIITWPWWVVLFPLLLQVGLAGICIIIFLVLWVLLRIPRRS